MKVTEIPEGLRHDPDVCRGRAREFFQCKCMIHLRMAVDEETKSKGFDLLK